MPNTVIATYRVPAAQEDAFRALLTKHWPTLHGQGLTTDEPPVIYRHGTESGPVFFEIFSWKDADAPRVAHETPEVMAVWEPMGAITEARDGRPAMEFPHVERVELA